MSAFASHCSSIELEKLAEPTPQAERRARPPTRQAAESGRLGHYPGELEVQRTVGLASVPYVGRQTASDDDTRHLHVQTY